MYKCLDTIPACDGRTDILLRHSPRYAYASCGKNRHKRSRRRTKYLLYLVVRRDLDRVRLYGSLHVSVLVNARNILQFLLIILPFCKVRALKKLIAVFMQARSLTSH